MGSTIAFKYARKGTKGENNENFGITDFIIRNMDSYKAKKKEARRPLGTFKSNISKRPKELSCVALAYIKI